MIIPNSYAVSVCSISSTDILSIIEDILFELSIMHSENQTELDIDETAAKNSLNSVKGT